jgi:hypothetical protein
MAKPAFAPKGIFQPTRHNATRRGPVTKEGYWQEQCKGYGDELVGWVTEEMEQHQAPARNLMARAMCSGCPVFDTCAAETLRMRDHGVVRAGQALSSDSHSPDLYRQYEELREHLGRPHGAPFDLRECRVCGKTMSEKNFPGTVVAHSKILCVACYHQRVKENGQ